MTRLAQQVMNEGLSVRHLEKAVRERLETRASAIKSATGEAEPKRAQIRNLEQMLMQATGTKVEIQESRRKGSGKVIIHYYSLDDFDRITERLGVQES
jgi:ParB family chromosome partitioning protein